VDRVCCLISLIVVGVALGERVNIFLSADWHRTLLHQEVSIQIPVSCSLVHGAYDVSLEAGKIEGISSSNEFCGALFSIEDDLTGIAPCAC